jgi:hypothetical protein
LRTAETARRAADAARDAAQNLRANEAWMASLVEKGADGLSTLAETLRQNDLKHLLSRAEDFARKQPVLFAGAAVALGFTLSRAARAGTQDTQERGALKQETMRSPSIADIRSALAPVQGWQAVPRQRASFSIAAKSIAPTKLFSVGSGVSLLPSTFTMTLSATSVM